jgi:Uncharacterized protein family UPF0016
MRQAAHIGTVLMLAFGLRGRCRQQITSPKRSPSSSIKGRTRSSAPTDGSALCQPAPVRTEGPCPKYLSRDPDGIRMEAFLISTLVVGLAEIGDKTQILSLMLAARFQRLRPIIFGIFFATVANHAAAGPAGTYFGSLLSGPWTRWILGLSFLSVAISALLPNSQLPAGASARTRLASSALYASSCEMSWLV